MISAQLQRVGVLAHGAVDAPEVGDALTHQLFGHLEVNHRQHLRVVAGAVMIEVAELVVFGERVELVLLQFGIGEARERDRIKIGIFERNLQLLGSGADKARIEVCVVRNQEAVARKLQKRRDSLVDFRRVGDHFVGDAGQLGNLFGNRRLGIDKGIEAVEHLVAADAYRADFSNAAVCDRKSGRFDIKNDKFAVEPLVAFAVQRARRFIRRSAAREKYIHRLIPRIKMRGGADCRHPLGLQPFAHLRRLAFAVGSVEIHAG